MIFEENNKAIYLQIADRICDDIMQGKYDSDNRIPSVREYAASVRSQCQHCDEILRAANLQKSDFQ